MNSDISSQDKCVGFRTCGIVFPALSLYSKSTAKVRRPPCYKTQSGNRRVKPNTLTYSSLEKEEGKTIMFILHGVFFWPSFNNDRLSLFTERLGKSVGHYNEMLLQGCHFGLEQHCQCVLASYLHSACLLGHFRQQFLRAPG